METQKNSENNIVLEMKRLLGRMMVQIDYMYRNDREMSRLDLDIMMERTRDFYDLLCDYQSDKIDNEVVGKENVNTEINEGGELINHDVEFEIETPEEAHEPDINGENDGDDSSIDRADDFDEENNADNEVVEENMEESKVSLDEDIDDEDWEDEEDETFHIEPINEDDYEDSPMIIPAQEEKAVVEDNSLAARLQRTPVSDIKAALGINDKMMIINDLFGGSVERYNKSVDALNYFTTLSGAKVYMSELQIELQWDTESQAYKTLNDLVERRFI